MSPLSTEPSSFVSAFSKRHAGNAPSYAARSSSASTNASMSPLSTAPSQFMSPIRPVARSISERTISSGGHLPLAVQRSYIARAAPPGAPLSRRNSMNSREVDW